MLTKDQLLAQLKTRTEEVSVPGLDGTLRIRAMSGYDRDAFQKVLQAEGITDSAYFGALIATCVVNDDGSPMFSESEVETLRGSHAELVRAIGLACQRVNGLGKAAEETAAKN
ncbi:hypothetical protein QFZ94_004806 [Paraburkholderia sp. JPY465]|uniref:hypothetical protein n=1 Tax=Paraburkholderia sp. JPY465 TaxID=3042285 RepID=UPI003D1C4991